MIHFLRLFPSPFAFQMYTLNSSKRFNIDFIFCVKIVINNFLRMTVGRAMDIIISTADLLAL